MQNGHSVAQYIREIMKMERLVECTWKNFYTFVQTAQLFCTQFIITVQADLYYIVERHRNIPFLSFTLQVACTIIKTMTQRIYQAHFWILKTVGYVFILLSCI